jgi:hypothetical protein
MGSSIVYSSCNERRYGHSSVVTLRGYMPRNVEDGCSRYDFYVKFHKKKGQIVIDLLMEH